MEIKYIGSASIKLENLENNHRNARSKKYSMTKFRLNLEKNHKGSGEFEWLVIPALRTLQEVEELEKALINKHLPIYNVDYDPVASSERNGRYITEDAQQKRPRGVYCFKDE